MDFKTSAFFAYIAIERNAKAFLALSQYKPLKVMKKQNLKLSRLSIDMCGIIRKEFFPEELLNYEEFGYDDFRKY